MTYRQKQCGNAIYAQASPKVCPNCGQALEVLKRKIPFVTGRQISVTLMCECVRQAKERQHKQCQVQNMRRILAKRGFETGKYARMTLANWRNGNVGANVIAKAKEYVDGVTLNHRNWLYMYGGYGVGKTHIAVAVTRQITLGRKWRPALLAWTQYCGRIQQSWHDKRIKTDWHLIREARILVLDDIDKKDAAPWTLSQLYDVVDYRCIHNLPTIITANRSIGELSSFWGAEKKKKDLSKAIISRILGQVIKVIHFEGEDYRLLAE